MRVALLVLSLFGLLFVTACGAQKNMVVDAGGTVRGDIRLEKEKTAGIFDAKEQLLGRVRGDLVRDASGKRAGAIRLNDGHTVITDAADNPVGSVENKTECYGKSQKLLGRIQMTDVQPEVAGAACLLLFLQ